jgi:hypothetical protein
MSTVCENIRSLVREIPDGSMQQADFRAFGHHLDALDVPASRDDAAAVARLVSVSLGFSDADPVDSQMDWTGELQQVSDRCVHAGEDPIKR